MSLHNEIEFENEICERLVADGWLYSPNDDGYDRARALFPEDVLTWVQATQSKSVGAARQESWFNRSVELCHRKFRRFSLIALENNYLVW